MSCHIIHHAGGQANGGTQNQGNFIGDRSSTRLWAPPGGKSSFSLSHGYQDENVASTSDAGSRRRFISQDSKGGSARNGPLSMLMHDEGPQVHAVRYIYQDRKCLLKCLPVLFPIFSLNFDKVLINDLYFLFPFM